MVVKKRLVGILGGIMLTSMLFVGCSNKDKSTDEQVKEIGICQFSQHAALDSAYEGFVDKLKEEGYEDGKNIKLDYKNAQGDFSTAQTISKQFVDSKKDLIFSIATQAAQAGYNSTKDIPIVFTAVTDPVAAEIAKDWKSSGTNTTGVSDMVPIDKQLEILKKLVPDVKTMGFIYNTSEENSRVQLEAVKEGAKKYNIDIKDIGITNVNEIDQNLRSEIKNIDVLYTPTDNSVASSYALVSKICSENNVPIFGAEEAVVEKGGLVTLGINYYELGKATALKAIEIFNGKNPSEIEISTLDNLTIKINEDSAKRLNIEIPDDIKEKAEMIKGGE